MKTKVKQNGALEILVIVIILLVSGISLVYVFRSGSVDIDRAKIGGSIDSIINLKNNISIDAHNKYDFSYLNNQYILNMNLVPKEFRYDSAHNYFLDSNNLSIKILNNVPAVFIPGSGAINNDATVNDGYTIIVGNLPSDVALMTLQKLSPVFYGIRSYGTADNLILKNNDGLLDVDILSGWLDTIYASNKKLVGLELITL